MSFTPSNRHGVVNWFVGSNGNQFGDFLGARFCIWPAKVAGFKIARNGIEIGFERTFEEAKRFIEDQTS